MITRRAFRASKGSVPAARRFVSEALDGLTDEQRDTASVMVSELATNALLHASSGFDITVDRSAAEVTVSVTDRGDGTPAVQSPGFEEPHGRGLRIVQAFSDDWGVTPAPGTGKTVWFRLSIGGPASPPAPDGVAAERQDGHGTPTSDVPFRPGPAGVEPTEGPANRPSAHLRGSRSSADGQRGWGRRCRRWGRSTTRPPSRAFR
jgi:anti-sigma regulatory factor (Ser/Thr protein kinase)